MTDHKTAFLYPRLSLAYFLQFAIWGSWAMTLGGYADKILKLDVGILYIAIPLAAVAALFVGPIVDRLFAAEKVVAVLHLVGGACLIACGFQKTFVPLFVFMLLHGLCFMPSIALMNSVVFRHIPNSNNAPKVFVFGTLGWIVVNLVIDVFAGGAGTPNFFFIGGGAAILLGFYSLTLPHTPPTVVAVGDKKASLFGALQMLKDPAFAIFLFCVVIASIPACGLYFPMAVPLFTERDFPSPVALTTLNQFSELLFMLALPFFASRIGLKKCLLLGMAAWCLRYIFFMQPAFSFALLGLLLHGFCYSFLYVAAYMYADKKAPAALKASVQGLMTFLLLGVGQVAGSLLLSYELRTYPAAFPQMKVSAQEASVPLPAWNDSKMEDTAWKYLNLSGTVNELLGGKKQATVPHLGIDLDANKDGVVTWNEIDALSEGGLTYGEGDKAMTYTKTDLQNIFKQIAVHTAKKEVPDADLQVKRDDWLAAQTKDWKNILFLPVLIVAICFFAFLVLGKDPAEPEKKS